MKHIAKILAEMVAIGIGIILGTLAIAWMVLVMQR